MGSAFRLSEAAIGRSERGTVEEESAVLVSLKEEHFQDIRDFGNLIFAEF